MRYVPGKMGGKQKTDMRRRLSTRALDAAAGPRANYAGRQGTEGFTYSRSARPLWSFKPKKFKG